LLLQSGVASRADTLWTLAGFLSYGVEVGAVFLMFSAYLLLRTGKWRSLPKAQVLFFTLALRELEWVDFDVFTVPAASR
jgi:hypothetical protein